MIKRSDFLIYSRIIIENDNLDAILSKLNLNKKSEFAFYDLVYLNKNGANITEDTLKIRVYQKNEWDNKNVIVIRKTAPIVNGMKEDNILLHQQFDTEKEALDFVEQTLSSQYEYKFKLEKSGIEYINEQLHVWVENIKDIGISIEFGSMDAELIENAILLFPVKERLTESVPEYLYKKYFCS